MINGISVPAEQRTRFLEGLLVLVGAIAVASFILVPEAGLLVVIACAALWFIAVVCEVFQGKIEGLVSCWAAFFPLGYFILFPREHPIVTVQRLVVLGAFTGLFFAKPITLIAIPRPLRRAALICLAFIAVAAVSLAKSPEISIRWFLPPDLVWLVHHCAVRCSSSAPRATRGCVHLLNHLRGDSSRRDRHGRGSAPL